MSLTVNIKHLHVHMPALPAIDLSKAESAATLPPTDCIHATGAVDFGVDPDRRWRVVPSHTRIAADGAHLPASDTATPHVAVIDHATGLMWTVESLGDPDDADEGLPHAECEKRCAELRLLGFDDWRMPTRAELAALVDDTRHEPAIDTALFPRVKPRWHWTSTPAAWSSASAWVVYFYDGSVYYGRRLSHGFALAVRRAGQ